MNKPKNKYLPMKRALAIFAVAAFTLSRGAFALAQNTPDAAQNPPALTQTALAPALALPESPAPALALPEPPAPAPAAQQVSTSGQPKNSEGFTIAPISDGIIARNYIFEMAPGSQASYHARIKNFAPQTVHFSLYGADPTVSNTGSPAYETRDQSIDGPGTWIKFGEPEIDLKGGEEKTVSFTVTIPPSTAEGEYRAGVTMEKSRKDANIPGITIATRMVAQAKIIVGKGAPPIPAMETPHWQTYYFWASLALFIISLAVLVWTLLHEKKSKHGAAHHEKHGHARGRRPHGR